MSTISRRVTAVFSVVAGLLVASPAFAAAWKTNVNYGANTIMDLYVPDKLATPPGIVVALHYCSGHAMDAHSWFQSAADKYGFIIIAPGAGGNCFDAKPDRAGERANIVKMVQYVITQNGADPKRVVAAGASSGACMTQALLAAYPEVFAAGSSLAAVPAGAWTGGNTYAWSTPGTTTAQQWGDKVRNADPGFTGTRPRIQLWHGQGDTLLTYSQNYPAEVSQWTNVFGVTDANGTKESIKPMGAQDTWARTSYKDATSTVVVEANSGPSNVPHDLTGRGLWNDVVRFLGLDATPSGNGGAGGGSGGAGGSSGTGGAGAGGVTGTGGSSPTGGTTGGGRGGSGGTTSSGGSTGSGGTTSSGSGGVQGSAGVQGTAGTYTPPGGSTGSTGSAGTTGQAGATGSAGVTGQTGSAGSPDGGGGGSDGGCNVGGRGEGSAPATAALLIAALGMALRRRNRRA